MPLNVFDLDGLQAAAFVDRPNRFVVRCRLGRRLVTAFLPNPGRLWELLLPGATVHLLPRDVSETSTTKHAYTAVAVERDGRPVLLHTHWTNRVVRTLLERRLVPGLEDATVLAAEVQEGRSRFDFLLQQGRSRLLLEVKSCTLFGNRVAMFPDAVTERGRRHLLELASLSRPGQRPVVLFLVHTPDVDWFLPDYHTDLAFSQTLLHVRNELQVIPVAVRWTRRLTLSGPVKRLEVPWSFVEQEARDRGSYLLILRLSGRRTVEVGRLGRHDFAPGYYVYVGSAQTGLSARLVRHVRRRKRLHWHVDYLRQVADECVPLAVRSSRREECELAGALEGLFVPGPTGFGSSDCDCPTHLFYSDTPPLHRPDFHELLQRFRMRRPE